MYSWGVSKRLGALTNSSLDFRDWLFPPLTLASSPLAILSFFLAARNFDLQKSEDMLRKVRPHTARAPPPAHYSLGDSAKGARSLLLLPSSLGSLLCQTRALLELFSCLHPQFPVVGAWGCSGNVLVAMGTGA